MLHRGGDGGEERDAAPSPCTRSAAVGPRAPAGARTTRAIPQNGCTRERAREEDHRHEGAPAGLALERGAGLPPDGAREHLAIRAPEAGRRPAGRHRPWLGSSSTAGGGRRRDGRARLGGSSSTAGGGRRGPPPPAVVRGALSRRKVPGFATSRPVPFGTFCAWNTTEGAQPLATDSASCVRTKCPSPGLLLPPDQSLTISSVSCKSAERRQDDSGWWASPRERRAQRRASAGATTSEG